MHIFTGAGSSARSSAMRVCTFFDVRLTAGQAMADSFGRATGHKALTITNKSINQAPSGRQHCTSIRAIACAGIS